MSPSVTCKMSAEPILVSTDQKAAVCECGITLHVLSIHTVNIHPTNNPRLSVHLSTISSRSSSLSLYICLFIDLSIHPSPSLSIHPSRRIYRGCMLNPLIISLDVQHVLVKMLHIHQTFISHSTGFGQDLDLGSDSAIPER